MFQNYARTVYPQLLKRAPLVMGILNVTDNSFAEATSKVTVDKAVSFGLQMLRDGADIVDVGAEASNPQAEPVSVEVELTRLLPVVQTLAPAVRAVGKLLSVDTRRARVMDAAIGAGATMINDIRALTEPDSLEVAARHNVPTVLMHDQPPEIRADASKKYDYRHLVPEVLEFLRARLASCEERGMTNLIVDPGIGFSKRGDLNLLLLRELAAFKLLDKPLLVGASKKQFIGDLTGVKEPSKRCAGSIAVAIWSYLQGAAILRVHDVVETRQALLMIKELIKKKEAQGD